MSSRFLLPTLFLLVFHTGILKTFAQQEIDFTALAEPSFANRLALTDEQRAAVARILDERVRALVAAKLGERPQVLSASNKKLEELLTDEQKATFAALVAGGKLRFNFRQRGFVQRTVTSWFIASFSLGLSDVEFLRLRDVYARVISKSGVIFKGYADNPNNISPSEKKNTKDDYDTIIEEFTNQVKQTIGVENYNLLVSMTDNKRDGSMMRFRRGRRIQ